MSKGLKGKKVQQQLVELEEESEGEASLTLGLGEQGESDMMMMFRAMMAEQRRADEVRVQEQRRADEARALEQKRADEARALEYRRAEEAREERKEELRVKREMELADKQAEIQKELEKRQYEQQVALLKIQQDMGEKASVAHREYQSGSQKRDRALYTIPALKDNEDIEEWLTTAERRLGAAEVKRDDWVSVIDAKLTGKVASMWQDLLAKTGDYQEARDGLLKASGYTPKSACEKLFDFKMEQNKGLTADQLYLRGQQLLRRAVAPVRLEEKAEFSILRGWLGHVIPRKAKAALDARAPEDAGGLVDALRDYLELEGDRANGQSATFRRNGGEGVRNGGFTLNCYKCGKPGHKVADCWKGVAGGEKVGSESSGGGAPRVITCFTCQEEGHKSPQCPRNVRKEKGGAKVEPAAIRRVWRSGCQGVALDGIVNGYCVPVTLDSGAEISVVPKSLVGDNQLTGGEIAVRPFGSSSMILLPMASLSFEIGDLAWEELVAVAPSQEGVEEEVIFGLSILSERGSQLIQMAKCAKSAEVVRVTTRAQAKTDENGKVIDSFDELEDEATPKPISGQEEVAGGGAASGVALPQEDVVVLGSCVEELDRGGATSGVALPQEEDVVKDFGLELDSYEDDVLEEREDPYDEVDPEANEKEEEIDAVLSSQEEVEKLIARNMASPSSSVAE